ncbi:hypothetical protein CXG81DRAFT_12385 [Caulochytrium protostelioides]|uniref:Complex III subunit 9 n=1 Tax=Caulochytrium protostelioides TaxID=1555241 RepID=A0A4P9X1U6_9FUNG|nr:ubiquinol-cytochrome C reductase [Caulochytrium protostelioides]RKP01136.1 hypothetical protein CXG81DRAFT_12385 [Caulochytrium protostelioides]|eukprot:RKP01136.1 hypothetical protein CXG81DRAFT_12385 [Caulochytrium protostelioides]
MYDGAFDSVHWRIAVFVKRSSAFTASIVVSAFAFEVAFDTVTDRIWDTLNHGRQWKDLKARLEAASDE